MAMSSEQESVITPERFRQGLTWRDWLKQLEEDREDYEANYASVTLDPSAVAAIKTMMAMPRGPNVWGVSRHGPGKVLAICEPWCMHVLRGLPVMARLCEATGMELRILSRDANPDIMTEVLYKGEYQSIPVFIFYTKSDEYLGHWIEMPAEAREEQAALQRLVDGMQAGELSPEERRRYAEEYEALQQGPVWDKWRQAQVAEVRELLETALERAKALEEIRDMAFFD
jgi:hypothetical protein